MSGERTTEGWQLRLRPQGGGRYLTGAFLTLWLCGWAVGESFVLWMLITGALSLLTGRPQGPGREPLEAGPALVAGAFLLVWLTLWTIGGIAAISELMRVLWGEDRITVLGGRLTVTWMRGPFRRTRQFDRDAIRRINLFGRDDRLALEAADGRIELSRLGSRAERVEGAAALREGLGIPDVSSGTGASIPRGWEEIITPEGERALVTNQATRAVQARVARGATMLLAALTFLVARQSIHRPDLIVAACIAFAFTLGVGSAALWLARGRWEWRIGSGRLTLRRRYGQSVRDVFEGRRLVLESMTDSDGDASYLLYATAEPEPPAPTGIRWRSFPPKNSRTVARLMNDATAIRDLAAWLSRETGLSFEDRTTPQAQAMELAQLRAALESSGRFGQWAAKMIDRLSERRKAG